MSQEIEGISIDLMCESQQGQKNIEKIARLVNNGLYLRDPSYYESILLDILEMLKPELFKKGVLDKEKFNYIEWDV